MIEPYGFEKWNRALQGAFRKGYDAALAGKSVTACPYDDKRTSRGALTWSRSFIKAWDDGWECGDAERQKESLTPLSETSIL